MIVALGCPLQPGPTRAGTARLAARSSPPAALTTLRGVAAARARGAAARAGAVREQAPHAPRFSVLLECDGVLTDLHVEGHRVAFNRAFSELGYDCTSWNAATYHDLLRTGDGTGAGMVAAYFGLVGWPQFLPTNERQLFADKVYALKRDHLRRMLAARELPLRAGAREFVGELVAAGVAVGVISETASWGESGVADAVLAELGLELAGSVRVFPSADLGVADEAVGGEGSEETRGVLTLDQAIAAAQAQAKVQGAVMFARAAAGEPRPLEMGVSSHLLAGSAMAGRSLLSAGFISAANLTLDVPSARCAVLAASNTVMEAAKGAGALTIAVPPSLSARGRFPAADASFDGYGPGGGATWPRLQAMLQKRAAPAAA